MILDNQRYTVRILTYGEWDHNYGKGILIGDNFTYSEVKGFIRKFSRTSDVNYNAERLLEEGKIVHYLHSTISMDTSYDNLGLYSIVMNKRS